MDKPFQQFSHKVHWLVDFNNRACPAFYPDGGKSMTDFQESLTQRTDHIVLSSNSLLKELQLYYPDYKNKISILRFACSLPSLGEINIAELKKKYDLTRTYFMSPNQFWEHKNQLVLIEALRVLKQKGLIDFDLVFTGSMTVTRGKGHMLEKLLEKVNEYGLKEQIKFLGIIDRSEQLVLMKHAKALIQPSLYEGWSTLVEEAKALDQRIILSDLPVHREQDCMNSYFFDPTSPEQLAEKIALVSKKGEVIRKTDYTKNVVQFGDDILKMLLHELN
ncbi:MAG: glycosyltransferase [Flavobacterium sp.]|nr:MAG: glycosyltransferase [Flavobacterium sp.]